MRVAPFFVLLLYCGTIVVCQPEAMTEGDGPNAEAELEAFLLKHDGGDPTGDVEVMHKERALVRAACRMSVLHSLSCDM